MDQDIRSELAKGYSRRKQTVDVVAIILFFAAELWLLWKLIPSIQVHPFASIAGIITGYIGADFISGVVHWLGDTWGSAKTPLVGRAFIRPFREHHVDEKAITRHDFIETNGTNSLVTLIILIPTLFLLPPTLGTIWTVLGVGFFSLCLSLFGTNQFHKWAHAGDKTPSFVRSLQKMHLILDPDHHRIHHTNPFDRYYCITVGWMNPILSRIRFFRILERIIHTITGAQPRGEDLALVRLSKKHGTS
ncbi:fatty acid desaturase family protein [Patescibacteria group bacterium]|nr:fatty acid desaturase family protein [Patescibacteria group bacterium]